MRFLLILLFSSLTISAFANDLKKIPDCDNMPGGCDNMFKVSRDFDHDYYNPAPSSCTVNLLDRQNRVRDSFRAPQCTSVLNRCNAEIQRSHYYGAYCQVERTHRPPRREIERSCTYNSVERNRRHSRVTDRFTATARGIDPVRVQERACKQAERDCNRHRNYYESCERAQRRY